MKKEKECNKAMVARKYRGEHSLDEETKISSESDSNSEDSNESDSAGAGAVKSESDGDESEVESHYDDDGGESIDADRQPPLVTGETCTFDLRNLLVINSHQVESAKLFSTSGRANEEITIGTRSNFSCLVDEDHLLERATDGCTQLINALWQLPNERSDVGPLASLPSFSLTKLPRQLVS